MSDIFIKVKTQRADGRYEEKDVKLAGASIDASGNLIFENGSEVCVKSPNGTAYRVSADDTGAITGQAVS